MRIENRDDSDRCPVGLKTVADFIRKCMAFLCAPYRPFAVRISSLQQLPVAYDRLLQSMLEVRSFWSIMMPSLLLGETMI